MTLFSNTMLKNKVIIIMSNLPLNWSTDYVTQTASVLKSNNFVVLCDLTKRHSLKEYFLQKNRDRIMPYMMNSILIYNFVNYLPFKRFLFITKANEFINAALLKLVTRVIGIIKGKSTTVIWTFDPRFYSFYKEFKKINYTIIYDCVDYFAGSTLDPQESIWVKNEEKKLLQLADYVFTISYTLKRLHQRVRKNIYVVPQGFRLETFHENGKVTLVKKFPKNKPIIGYIGGINFRLDYKLIYELASLFKNYSFVFAGPIQADTSHFIKFGMPYISKLKQLSNVYFIGSISKNQIPYLIDQFSVGIIPYSSTFTFNRFSYPMKLFEYFYSGKPVISSQIDELRRFKNYVFIATDKNKWIRLLQELTNKKWPEINKQRQRQLAINNSWKNKIDAIEDILTEDFKKNN